MRRRRHHRQYTDEQLAEFVEFARSTGDMASAFLDHDIDPTEAILARRRLRLVRAQWSPQ